MMKKITLLEAFKDEAFIEMVTKRIDKYYNSKEYWVEQNKLIKEIEENMKQLR